MSTIGIDLGGTKIAAALVADDGTIINEWRRLTPPRGGAERILDAIGDLVHEIAAASEHPLIGIGLGVGGAVHADDGVILSATDILGDWAGTAVRAELESRVGLPVTVDNDVKVFAIGEHRFGAGSSLRNAVYVTVGTGVGGALFIDDKLVRGRTWSAGELGHVTVPGAQDRLCPCGHYGHLEGVASGPAMSRRYAERSQTSPLPLETIVDRAEHGDPLAIEVIAEGGEAFGLALAGFANTLDPEAIVLGGGVIGAHPRYLNSARSAFAMSVLPGPRTCPLIVAHLGAQAAVLGAASIAVTPVPSI